MAVNNVNGAQPRLLTFAEMGYTTPQAQVTTTPAAPVNGDTVEISGAKPKKKVSKGVIAAIAAVAVAALAAVGLAYTGKKANIANGVDVEKLFTKANFSAGFDKLKALPGELLARFRNKGEAPAPKGEPAPAPAPAPEAPAPAPVPEPPVGA